MMAQHCTRCYHCGVESVENTFKYYDNGKRTQPRYQCGNCQKLFTLGFHGRQQGRTYAKKRNVDPPELKDLPRECRCCGVADNAPFKYYNNKNLSQPRFKCLSCGQQFQMRVKGTGQERRLVHTSSYQRPPSNQKLGQAPNSNYGLNSDKDVSAPVPAPVDPWTPELKSGEDFSALSVEDARYLDSIEAGLNEEKEAPPPAAVLRLQLWASKLPLEAASEAILSSLKSEGFAIIKTCNSKFVR